MPVAMSATHTAPEKPPANPNERYLPASARRKTSAVFFVRPGESIFWKSLPYNLIALALGWWAIPWGPAFTIGAVKDNLQGGHDVTQRLIEQILDVADRQMRPKKRR